MAVKVLMPKGSDTMTEGKVLKWLKKEGDQVSTGDAVVEIETDKVDMEVEAMASGALRKVLVEAGKVVPVGELLAVIGKPEEDISSLLKRDGGKPATSSAAPAAGLPTSPAPPAALIPPATGGAIPAAERGIPSPPAEAGGRVLASPLARRMAQEIGVDLNRVTGSGPGGRIIRQDVERIAALFAAQAATRSGAVPAASKPADAAAPAPVLIPPRRPFPPPGGPDFNDEPLSAMRKTIAARLAQSLGPVPHFYLTIEVDMKRAQELRESANSLEPELKLTYNDIIVKACAAALRQHPEVNASFQSESLRYHNRVHIGVAVAIEGGLITPVIRDCDRKSLQDISREAKELIARARNRKLNPDEYVGSTFSVSNLGMLGIEEFSAVINPPEGAILAVGTVSEKPVVKDGRLEVGLRCRMTLSCDHRVVDGATGARFLQTLKQILENPVYLAF
jgi:pyruvate dehydrogenase E2 component (dihydrolipoamide acetyltransferase)